MSEHPSTRSLLAVYALLLALLGLTLYLAELDLGPWNLPAAGAIALAKALLVGVVFMNLRRSEPLVWLAAAAGFFWLSILIGGTLSDYTTRAGGGPTAAQSTSR